jgi:hypothetical protein
MFRIKKKKTSRMILICWHPVQKMAVIISNVEYIMQYDTIRNIYNIQ